MHGWLMKTAFLQLSKYINKSYHMKNAKLKLTPYYLSNESLKMY